MASMLNQRVIGVVENMSYLADDLPALRPPTSRYDVFGRAGDEVATTLSTRLDTGSHCWLRSPSTPSFGRAATLAPRSSKPHRTSLLPRRSSRWRTPLPSVAAAWWDAPWAWPLSEVSQGQFCTSNHHGEFAVSRAGASLPLRSGSSAIGTSIAHGCPRSSRRSG